MSTVVLDPPVRPAPTATPATAATPANSRRWLGLFAILAATIMNLLDTTVVNVGAPAIQASLGGTYTSLQWIAASYTLALAVGLLTGGRLGDMFGRRRVLLVGVVGFVAASLVCAVAWSPESLIAARVVQGLFAAIMVPQGFGLIRDLFPPNEIGKAFGAFGPIIGFSTILGPVVAGALIDADLFGTGWRMVFAINLPLGLFALLAGRAALPAANKPRTRTRLDVTGALTAAIGMVLLVFPLVQGRELGWPVWTFARMAASVPVFAAFAVRQLRRTGNGRDPLVELRLFTRRSYASGVLFVIVFFGSIAGFSLAIGMFLQVVLGYSPMKASLTMAAWAVGAFIGSGFGSTMMNRLGRHILHIGLALMLVGIAALYVVLQVDGLGVRELLGPLLVYGVGMGMIFVPLFDIIMGEVRDHEVGSAAGILESLQQLGAALGVAVLGTVFFGHLDVGVERVTLIAFALTAVTFALGFLLPRRARS